LTMGFIINRSILWFPFPLRTMAIGLIFYLKVIFFAFSPIRTWGELIFIFRSKIDTFWKIISRTSYWGSGPSTWIRYSPLFP